MTQILRSEIHPWIAAGLEKVRIGVCFLDTCTDWQQFYQGVQRAEELDYDSLWISDHPMLGMDCFSCLAALAITTSRIRLGSLVSSVCYRHPSLVARLATDIDRLSGGRFVLGLGIGDLAFEFNQMGIPFLPTSKRQKILEEAIHTIKQTWQMFPSGPVQKPHIPLLIAGGGEQVTLRQVAQHAHVANFGAHAFTGGASRLEDVARKCHVLSLHCEQFQRPFTQILRSYITLPLLLAESSAKLTFKQEHLPPPLYRQFQTSMVALTPQEAISYYRDLIQAGMQYFIIGVIPNDLETLELFSSVVFPAIANELPICQITQAGLQP